MQSVKCPHCGMVNWADATECKKCKKSLTDALPSVAESPSIEKEPSKSSNKLIILVAVAIVGLIVVFLVAKKPGSGLKNAPRSQTGGASPAPTELPPFSAENVESAKRALNELYKLQSVTEAGLNFTQYSERVLSAKVEFDAALRSIKPSTQTDAGFILLADEAMTNFIDAKDAWAATIKTDDGVLYVKDNPYTVDKYGLAQYAEKQERSVTTYEYVFRAVALNAIWTTANRNTAKAAALLPR